MVVKELQQGQMNLHPTALATSPATKPKATDFSLSLSHITHTFDTMKTNFSYLCTADYTDKCDARSPNIVRDEQVQTRPRHP